MSAGRANSFGRVTVVGTLNVDLVWQVATLPRPGQTVMAAAVERQFGGKGANQAVAAARQGGRVEMFGAVGDDADGRDYCAYLTREGIGCGHVARVSGVATGTAHVYVDASGENLIVVDRGANARLALTGLEADLRESQVLLAQLESPVSVVIEALRVAARLNVSAWLNPSPTTREFPWGEVPIDAVIVNEHECAECFQLSPAELTALAESARRDFLRCFAVNQLVVTQGAGPTLFVSRDEFRSVPTFAVTPRDTVGAGDMFAGTLAAQRAAGRDWPSALVHANVAAALSTLALGAQAAMPRKAEVERALAERADVK